MASECVLFLDLLLDLPSRLPFSLGAFLAAEGSFSRTTYSLLLPAFVCMVAPPCGAKAHGSALLASVCDLVRTKRARASWLTWLVRPDPCHLREPLAYMHHDSRACGSGFSRATAMCCSACLCQCFCLRPRRLLLSSGFNNLLDKRPTAFVPHCHFCSSGLIICTSL